MGLLDSVLGGLLGGSNNTSSGMGGVLGSLLGGGTMGQATGQATGGGLGDLVSRFEQAGLGNVIQSWMGNGPNQSISPGQLQDVFGHQEVQNMANQAGMQPGDFLSQLSQHLPHAVDQMTPNGQSPDSTMSV